MRPRFRSPQGPHDSREGSNLELVRVRRTQRDAGDARGELKGRSRRRGGRGRARTRRPPQAHEPHGFLVWLRKLLGIGATHRTPTRAQQEARALDDFQKHFRLSFADPDLLKLALTHRSYLSVTGQGPRESNERLEFLGDSVLGLVTSEFLYRENPEEHEGELTKAKSLLVSKAILSRRALAMGLGRFVLMSHSEVESGGRQRLSILADAFEAVIGAVYLDQGFEPARAFIHRWLLRESGEIVADKRHTNYKSHLQEYVQSTWRTHPIYRIRSEMGPDHSKHFLVEVLVGKRTLGDGRGRNKKEAEQAAARNALERAGVNVGGEESEPGPPRAEPRAESRSESRSGGGRGRSAEPVEAPEVEEDDDLDSGRHGRSRRRGRRGGRDREERGAASAPAPEPPAPYPASPGAHRRAAEPSTGRLAAPTRRFQPLPEVTEERPVMPEREPPPSSFEEDFDDVGRPEGPLEELHVDPYAWGSDPSTDDDPEDEPEARPEPEEESEDDLDDELEDELEDEPDDEPAVESPEPARSSEPPRAESRRETSRTETFRAEPVRPEPPPRSEPVRPEPPRPAEPHPASPGTRPSPSFGRRRSRRG